MMVRRGIPKTHRPMRLLVLRPSPGAVLASSGAFEFARAIMARYGSLLSHYRPPPLLHLFGPPGILPGTPSIHRWLSLALILDLRPTAMRPGARGAEGRWPQAQHAKALFALPGVVVYRERGKDRLIRAERWRELWRVPRSSAVARVLGTGRWAVQSELAMPSARPVFPSQRSGARASEIIVGRTSSITHTSLVHAQDASAEAAYPGPTIWPTGSIRPRILVVDADGSPAHAKPVECPALLPVGPAKAVERRVMSRIASRTSLRLRSGKAIARTGTATIGQAPAPPREGLLDFSRRGALFSVPRVFAVDADGSPAHAKPVERPALLPPGSRSTLRVGGGVGPAEVVERRAMSHITFWRTASWTSLRLRSGKTDARTGTTTIGQAPALSREEPAPISLLEARDAARSPFVPAGQAGVLLRGRPDAGIGRVATRRQSRHLFALPHLALTSPAMVRGSPPRRTVLTAPGDLDPNTVVSALQARDFLRGVLPVLAVSGPASSRATLPRPITGIASPLRRIVAAPSDEAVTGDSAGAGRANQLSDYAMVLPLRLSPRGSDPPDDHPMHDGVGPFTDAMGAQGHPEPPSPGGPEVRIGTGELEPVRWQGTRSRRYRALPGLRLERRLAPDLRAVHPQHWLGLGGLLAATPTARLSPAFRRHRREHPMRAGAARLRHHAGVVPDSRPALHGDETDVSLDLERQAGSRSLLVTLSAQNTLVVPPAAAIPRVRALPAIQPLTLEARTTTFGAVPTTLMTRTLKQGNLPDDEPIWGRAVGASVLVPAAPPRRLNAQPAPSPRHGGLRSVPVSADLGGSAEIVRLQQPPGRGIDVPRLADAVYRLIVDRVRREKHMRGR